MKRLETEHGSSALTRVFGVSRSAYADWKKREPSAREQANRKLDLQIREVFGEHRSRYGSPRVSRVLRARQVHCGENRVARRMRVLGLAARKKKGFVPRTTDSRHGGPIAANRLLESGTACRIDQVWQGDICQHPPVLPFGQRLRPLAISLRSVPILPRGKDGCI